MYFKLPIVEDKLEYEDPNDKGAGYNLINGKRVLNTDEIPFHRGGRPKIKKKAWVMRTMIRNYTLLEQSDTVE